MSNLTGRKFGKLTVLGRDYSYVSSKRTKWICQCECGNVKSILRDSLLSGRSRSCGCQRNKGKKRINATHGMSRTRIFHEWTSMRRRCKPQSPDAKIYYDRGISVCDEWESDFMSFYTWAMENGYDDTLTLDRINNDDGYYPQNCRWISNAVQQVNKRNTVFIKHNGQDYPLRSICRDLDFPFKTAYRRLSKMRKRGEEIDLEKLFAPIQENKIAKKYRTQ